MVGWLGWTWTHGLLVIWAGPLSGGYVGDVP